MLGKFRLGAEDLWQLDRKFRASYFSLTKISNPSIAGKKKV
jgi:hypothetical protein